MSRQKIGSKSAKDRVLYRGVAPSRAKKLRKYQRFSVQKWPKHRYLQCFVPSTFSLHSKKCVNSIFCHQPARNAVIYSVFLLCHWYLQCFVHLWSKKYWYLQHFLLFCMAPARDIKAPNCCNLQHFVAIKKSIFVKKCALLGQLGPFLGLMLGHLEPSGAKKSKTWESPKML